MPFCENFLRRLQWMSFLLLLKQRRLWRLRYFLCTIWAPVNQSLAIKVVVWAASTIHKRSHDPSHQLNKIISTQIWDRRHPLRHTGWEICLLEQSMAINKIQLAMLWLSYKCDALYGEIGNQNHAAQRRQEFSVAIAIAGEHFWIIVGWLWSQISVEELEAILSAWRRAANFIGCVSGRRPVVNIVHQFSSSFISWFFIRLRTPA